MEKNEASPLLIIGVQPDLVTRPLWEKLSEIAPEVEIRRDTPRHLGAELSSGNLDAALVPLLTILRNPEITMIPDIALVSEDKVGSVFLFSKTAPADIRKVLVDRSSVISIALLRALFRIRWSMQPVEVLSSSPLKPDYPFMDSDYDAYLVIGDAALQVEADFPHCLDLGEQWRQWTGLPFVWSVWGVRSGLLGPALGEMFKESMELGKNSLHEIARAVSESEGIRESSCLDVLNNLHFTIGDEEQRAIKRFFYYMSELTICDTNLTIQMYRGEETEEFLLEQTL